MSYIDNYAVAQSTAFQGRVAGAMASAAIAISSEATSAANHTNRVTLAKSVLAGQANWVPQFAIAVAINTAATSASGPTDAQIDTSVSSVWNAMAGTL